MQKSVIFNRAFTPLEKTAHFQPEVNNSSQCDVISFVIQNERLTQEPFLEKKFVQVYSVWIKIFQSQGSRAFASFGKCPHPRAPPYAQIDFV